MYIHLNNDWPKFVWNQEHITTLLAEVRYIQGRLLGHMNTLGFQIREEATLQTLTQDVLKTSEIEGEKLDQAQVRSSIAKRLGIPLASNIPPNRNVEGIVEMMIDATHNYQAPLTKERLWGWHAALFPTGRNGLHFITVGHWRTEKSGAMQVVSGPIGHEKIHFEAPSYDSLEDEMNEFINWFNSATEIDLVLKTAIAHFWFITIHPFEDGNGRIARALADMLLARSEKNQQRFYSMSSQIRRERKSYYQVLEQCQKGGLDISQWIEWFLNCLKRALLSSESILEGILNKSHFWSIHAGELFNDRQRVILNRLLDNEFYGKLTSSKWAKITKCSQDTALRDITELLKRQILAKENAGGRSTSYHLCPW